ncbi:MAG: cytochrome C oxidase subunit IV family protein [Candidatus Kapabacteria bacterium]|nr:cytochrome C oxidase subunit IV family protein [Candidatus Kapabacteria bacterium]
MENVQEIQQEHHSGYGAYVLIWLTLIGLTILTVSVAGFELGKLTLVVALGIAAIKSGLVINIFMHVKYDDKIFKFFIGVALMILMVAFVFTSLDVFFR